MRKIGVLIIGAVATCALLGFAFLGQYTQPLPAPQTGFKVHHSVAVWKKLLTPNQFWILREAGTEPAFSGKLLYNKKTGIYYCAACGQAIFKSTTKYNSGEGWPSFWKPIKGAVVYRHDSSLGMSRTEVLCSRCGSHLGHLFHDGPRPTGLRYCIDSGAMKFKPTPVKPPVKKHVAKVVPQNRP